MLAQIMLTLAVLGADPKANLDGTYIVTAGQNSGKEYPADHFKDTSVVIKGDYIVVYCARTGEQVDFTYKLADEKGHGIDMKVLLGADEGKISHGIYEQKGDRLRITYFLPGNSQRPTAFETKEGSGQMMFEMQRVAP